MITSKINPDAPNYATYVSDLTRGQMFPRVAGILLSTGIGAGIGAACGSTSGGLGAGPGAGIGAAVGLGVGVATVVAIDLTGFVFYKATLTKEAANELSEIFKNSIDNGLQCPISFNTMFDVPACLPTSKQVYERDELKKWVKLHGTCPMTRIPVKLTEIREYYTLYPKLINKTSELLQNKELTSKISKKQLEGYVLYKDHLETRLSDFEKNEFKNIVAKAEDKRIDYLEASRRFLILHNATKGIDEVVEDTVK